MTDRKKLIRLGIALAILIAVYAVFATVLPRLGIWKSECSGGNAANCSRVELKAGDDYEYRFTMPFDRVCGIDFLVENPASYVVALNADIELYDSISNLVYSKKTTSAYDAAASFGYIPVTKGHEYTLKLKVHSVGNGQDVEHPTVMANPRSGDIQFKLYGANSGAGYKAPFIRLYLIISVMVLLFVFFLDKKTFKDGKYCDWVLLGTLLVMAVFLVSQYYDLFMIIKSALRMFDSFKAGNFTDYYGSSYLAELNNQSNKMLFAYEYNFFQIFFVLILILPLTFFYDGTLTGGGMDGFIAVTYLTVVMVILFFAAMLLIRRITRACGMPEEYRRIVDKLFIFSPMIIHMQISHGQIDLMYITVILLSLPFYYKKKYRMFALIMSLAVAMKTLPLLIFFPLLLLANKKIKDIAINTVIVMAAPVLTKVLFEGTDGHKAISRIIEEDYSYVARIADVRVGDTVSLFVLAFVIICIICYMTKTDADNKKQMLYDSNLAVFAVYSFFVIFVDWHQQWMIPLALSMFFLLPFFKDTKITILAIVMEFIYILAADISSTSINKITFGLMPYIAGENRYLIEMDQLMENISPIAKPAIFTCLAAILLSLLVVFYRGRKDISGQKEFTGDRRYISGRMGILYGFILLYAWVFFYI